MNYKLLLTTSGTGSRLKELTKTMNKCLVPLNGKPTIQYILNAYDPSVPVVVTLGYLGKQVQEALLRDYPDRHFEFVGVDPYEGPGSSLGYSLLQARPALNCPFVFHACDTLVLEQVPEPTTNWAAGYVPPPEMNSSPYRTHKTNGPQLVALNDKGVTDFSAIHIGITGIHDHDAFWKILEEIYQKNPNDSTLSDVHVIAKMIAEGFSFTSVAFSTWLDTGNLAALRRAEKRLQSPDLSK